MEHPRQALSDVDTKVLRPVDIKGGIVPSLLPAKVYSVSIYSTPVGSGNSCFYVLKLRLKT